jgi:hypothetical protein
LIEILNTLGLERPLKDITKMKKIALAFGLLGLTTFANAADALNGSVWQTIDDETKQPKAIVKLQSKRMARLMHLFKNI